MKSKVSLHDHVRNREFMDGVNYRTLVETVSQRLGPRGILGLIDWGDNRAERCFEGIKRAFPEASQLEKNSCVLYVPSLCLSVIKGQEVSTINDGRPVHVFSIGLPLGKKLEHDRPISETLRRAYEFYGAIQGFDHPAGPVAGVIPHFERHPELVGELCSIPGVNAWEAYNSLSASTPTPQNIITALTNRLDGTNARSINFYNSRVQPTFPNIGLTEGPDGHHQFEVARAYFEVCLPDSSMDSERAFIEALRNGIIANKTYSGKTAQSFRGYVQHAAVNGFDMLSRRILGRRLFSPDLRN